MTLEKIQNKSNVKRKSVAASEKRNKDIESNFEFGNGELLGGDQHLPPKSDFDNFGDDLLSGD